MTQGSQNFVTSDRCAEVETVLFSLLAIVAVPAILAFEIENFLSLHRSDPCVKRKPTEHKLISAIEASLSKDTSLLSFTIIFLRIRFWCQPSKKMCDRLKNGNYMLLRDARIDESCLAQICAILALQRLLRSYDPGSNEGYTSSCLKIEQKMGAYHYLSNCFDNFSRS